MYAATRTCAEINEGELSRRLQILLIGNCGSTVVPTPWPASIFQRADPLKRRVHNAPTDLSCAVNRHPTFSNRRRTSIGLRLGVWLRVWCLPLCLLSSRPLLSTRLCLSTCLCLRRLLSSARVGLGWLGLAAVVAIILDGCRPVGLRSEGVW